MEEGQEINLGEVIGRRAGINLGEAATDLTPM